MRPSKFFFAHPFVKTLIPIALLCATSLSIPRCFEPHSFIENNFIQKMETLIGQKLFLKKQPAQTLTNETKADPHITRTTDQAFESETRTLPEESLLYHVNETNMNPPKKSAKPLAIFIHPVLADPSLSFSTAWGVRSFYKWFITADEFERMLEELYKNNYILVRTDDIFQIEDHQVKRLYPSIPDHKKPLLLSIDDMNIFQGNEKSGMINRIELDENGKLYATIRKNGNIINEKKNIIEILENFIDKHPDFSFMHARALLALTGKHGVLGYKINDHTSEKGVEERLKAKFILEKLIRMGWEFGSHTYYHENHSQISVKRLKEDLDLWQKDVGTLIAPTPYYIYPYGNEPSADSQKFKLLKSYGFSIFMGVSASTPIHICSDYATIGRIPIDGRYLDGKLWGSRNSEFISIRYVRDSVRDRVFASVYKNEKNKKVSMSH